jgi:lipopolysaccharide heptosyltransferase II
MRARPKPNFKKILVINIFGIGDVLFTTPLIANLKAIFPEAQIGYLCNRRSYTVLENNPHIGKIFIYERDEFDKIRQSSQFAYVKALFRFWDEIKKEKYDCVFDVSLSSLTSYFSAWAGIPRRIGFNYKNRSPLLTDRFVLKGYEARPVVEYYLDLLRNVGLEAEKNRLEIYLTPKEEQFAEDTINMSGFKKYKRTIGLVPGGGASWGKDALFKRWSTENYAKLADKIVENTDAAFILFGDKNEDALCQELSAHLKDRALNLCGKTTIKQMAALSKRCDLMILNDGGPLHISVAAGAKTLSFFGPVDESVYGPFPREGHHVLTAKVACRPCYRSFRRASCEHISCLRDLTVEDAYTAVKRII